MKCNKCGNRLKDNDIVAWKCNSCGKAFKFNVSNLMQFRIKKDKTLNQPILKCSSCGNWIDDGNENIFIKCSSCGNVMHGNLTCFDSANKTEVLEKLKKDVKFDKIGCAVAYVLLAFLFLISLSSLFDDIFDVEDILILITLYFMFLISYAIQIIYYDNKRKLVLATKNFYDYKIKYEFPKYKQKYYPKCPTCGSNDVGKIEIMDKIISFLTFGVFSSKFRKQYQCYDCDYKW